MSNGKITIYVAVAAESEAKATEALAADHGTLEVHASLSRELAQKHVDLHNKSTDLSGWSLVEITIPLENIKVLQGGSMNHEAMKITLIAAAEKKGAHDVQGEEEERQSAYDIAFACPS